MNPRQPRVMLLIDADNVSADVIDQAVGHVMQQHGAIHVRRAYCTAESALANLQLFKRHSIRPIVNLSTGKNSTDISLAVDAVDLVLAERPDVVVVVSSDSDFAPLVIRLREKGCRVEGIGQQGKTGDDSKPVYDDFTDLVHKSRGGVAASGARRAALAPVRKRAASRSPPAAEPARPAAATPPARANAGSDHKPTARAAPRAAARTNPRSVAPSSTAPDILLDELEAPAAAPRSAAAMPDDVVRILAAVPDLWRGAKIELGVAAEQLRAGQMLARSATSTRLFKKYPAHFALTPERQPNKVQYVGPRVV